MSANNIVIIDVEPQYTSEYIANVFWKQDIGKVSSITLIPRILDGKISNIAYVDFDSFCETDAAKDFIKCMQSDEYMFAHNIIDPENNCWLVVKNKYLGKLCASPYTTDFMPDFFEEGIDEFYQINDTKVKKLHSIIGFNNNHNKCYEIQDALARFWYLEKKIKSCPYLDDYYYVDEMNHFEVQIALHYFTRGQCQTTMYNILLFHNIQIDGGNHIRRSIGMDRSEQEDMVLFIEYCKSRGICEMYDYSLTNKCDIEIF